MTQETQPDNIITLGAARPEWARAARARLAAHALATADTSGHEYHVARAIYQSLMADAGNMSVTLALLMHELDPSYDTINFSADIVLEGGEKVGLDEYFSTLFLHYATAPVHGHKMRAQQLHVLALGILGILVSHINGHGRAEAPSPQTLMTEAWREHALSVLRTIPARYGHHAALRQLWRDALTCAGDFIVGAPPATLNPMKKEIAQDMLDSLKQSAISLAPTA